MSRLIENDNDCIACKLTDYILSVKYENIPDYVVDKLKLLLTDGLGVMIAGGRTEPSIIMEKVISRLGGNTQATVPAYGKKYSTLHAIFLNSAFANALDFDDNHPLATIGHPSAPLISPALAYAESRGNSGKELVEALTAGYEVVLRIGKAVEPTYPRMEKVNGYSTQQTFGALTVAGKLIGLDRDIFACAFGVAGVCAPLPGVRKEGLSIFEHPISWMKNNYGWCAMAGALAAELGEQNFIGCPWIFDGENGFWVMASSDQCNFDWYTHELGEKYLLIEIGFKPYACCRWTHAAIEAAEHAMNNIGKVNVEDIEKVTVWTFQEPFYNLNNRTPDNVLDAQFSLPYTVSLAINGKSPSRGIRKEDLKDEKVLDLARNMRVILDDEAVRAFSNPIHSEQHGTVEIELKNGKKVKERVTCAKGDSKNPMSEKEIFEKYKNLTEPIIGKEKSLRLLDKIWNIESISNLSNFFEL